MKSSATLRSDHRPERGVFQARLHSVTLLLTLFPDSGQRTTSRYHPQRRRLLATPYPYVVFYDVREHEVVVIAVRHAARDPSSVLDAP